MKGGGGGKRNASLEAGRAGIHGNPQSSNQEQALSHGETQWRYLPTSMFTQTNKEEEKWEGQTAAQKQD